jgi:HD superfamily phosphohydrolase
MQINKSNLLIDEQLLNELLSIPLYQDIINSKSFKRLKNISFLGAIDYINPTKKKFYRYEHSLSVATLALLYSKLKKFNKKDKDNLVVSALLHDIGHTPLSHSIENNFKKKYGINHHINGNNIILGNSIFRYEIKNILNDYDIDEKYIIKILNGDIDNEISFALINPINIDTIDGINRCYLSMNYSDKYNKLGLVYKQVDIVKALVDKNEIVLNSFWELKQRMYKDFIHNPINLYADFFASNFIQDSMLSKDDFTIDDKRLRDNNLELFKSLRLLRSTAVKQKLKYKKREYNINSNSINSYSDILSKYTSLKYEHTVFISLDDNIKKEQTLWN